MNNFGLVDSNKKNTMDFDCDYHTIVLHNTGNRLEPTMKKIYDKHIVDNGWTDIGYHYIIGRKDKQESYIYEGRPLIFKGSHASSHNSKKIGILIQGDFEHQWWDNNDEIEKEQIFLLKKIIKKLKQEIPTIKYLIGHLNVLSKQKNEGCPGAYG